MKLNVSDYISIFQGILSLVLTVIVAVSANRLSKVGNSLSKTGNGLAKEANIINEISTPLQYKMVAEAFPNRKHQNTIIPARDKRTTMTIGRVLLSMRVNLQTYHGKVSAVYLGYLPGTVQKRQSLEYVFRKLSPIGPISEVNKKFELGIHESYIGELDTINLVSVDSKFTGANLFVLLKDETDRFKINVVQVITEPSSITKIIKGDIVSSDTIFRINARDTNFAQREIAQEQMLSKTLFQESEWNEFGRQRIEAKDSGFLDLSDRLDNKLLSQVRDLKRLLESVK